MRHETDLGILKGRRARRGPAAARVPGEFLPRHLHDRAARADPDRAVERAVYRQGSGGRDRPADDAFLYRGEHHTGNFHQRQYRAGRQRKGQGRLDRADDQPPAVLPRLGRFRSACFHRAELPSAHRALYADPASQRHRV